MDFEWSDEKAIANLSKHGVSFDEAKTVFDDPLYVDFYDPDHSDDEERFIIIGSRNITASWFYYIQNAAM